MNMIDLAPQRRTSRPSPHSTARRAGQVIALLLALAGCSKPAEPPTVWVGHLAPLSGARQGQGEEAVRAIELALGPIHDSGERFARHRVGTIHADAAQADQARAEATRLITVNRVAALLVGPGAEGVNDILATARTHGVGVVVSDGWLDRLPMEGVVALTPGPEARGRAMASFARDTLRLKRVALVADNRDRAATRAAAAFAVRWGNEPTQLVQWSADTPLKTVGADRPQAVVLAMGPEKARSINRDGFDVGLPLLLLHPEAGPAVRAALGQWADKATLYTATAYAPEAPLSTEGAEWRAAYSRKFNDTPGTAAVLSREGTELLLLALRQGGTERPAVRKALEGTTELAGLTGTIRWDKGSVQRPLFVLRWREGKASLAGTIP